MKDRTRYLLEHYLEEIRNQPIPPGQVEQSARRVRERLFQSAEADMAQGSHGPETELSGGPIAGCADFQALIPAYLARELSVARSLLLEDHTRECIVCRHALHQARLGNETAPAAASLLLKPRRNWKFALAVGISAAAIALILLAGVEGLLPGPWAPGGASATIESVNGAIYAVSGQSSRALTSGDAVAAGEEIRTAPDSTAIVRLPAGSQIEMGLRANLAITRGWMGTSIRLAQGSIIVEAAGRDSGHLTVATPDCLISDKGTIFAVSQSVKGSRVSVIQGLVRVKAAGQSNTVRAGGQFAVGSSLTTVPIDEQISWSPDAGRYLAILGELAGMSRELQAMPGPPPRFSSELIRYVPENTVIYAAIPNLATTLNEINSLLKEHLARSILLREWWQKQQASGSAWTAEEILKRVEACNNYLGNEIVFAATRNQASGELRPVVLARVEKSGFQKFLEQQLRVLGTQKGTARFRIVTTPADLPQTSQSSKQIFILLRGNLMAASSDAGLLRKIAALVESGHSSGFAGTDFYSAIERSYRSGAGWLLAANLEQISSQSVHKKQGGEFAAAAGLTNVKYVFAESKNAGPKPENRVTLSFAGKRRGVASWLAAPGPMGGLDFVSPQASFAFSFVLRNPKTLMDDFFSGAGQEGAKARQALALFESQTGVSVEKDLAGSLGGEVTVAQDGPLLPTPQWLVAMEVYNPEQLETAIQKLVSVVNQKSGTQGHSVRLTQKNAGGRVYYALHFDASNSGRSLGQGKRPGFPEIHYTFADGYWLLARSRADLDRAIQNRETGYSLASSREFQDHLPKDGSAYFSALMYEDVAKKLGPLLQELQSSGLAQGGESLANELKQNESPIIIGAYGEPDRLVFVSNENPVGLGMNSLMMGAEALLHTRRPGLGAPAQ